MTKHFLYKNHKQRKGLKKPKHDIKTQCFPVLNRKKLQNTSLSNLELSVILGGLLGDGHLSLTKGYKNARYKFRHSCKQSNYFYYKANCLQRISSPGSIQKQKPDGWSENEKLLFTSRASTCLSEIYSITHPSGSIKVQRRWLNHLTSLSLAIWWFDDGSIVGGGRQGCISTDGFSLKENQICAQYLKKVWNIEARIHPVQNYNRKVKKGEGPPKGLDNSPVSVETETEKNKKQENFSVETSDSCEKSNAYRLYLKTSNLKKFLTIIIPHLCHKDMLYKCTLRYKCVHLQERWISHMKLLLPEQVGSDVFFPPKKK